MGTKRTEKLNAWTEEDRVRSYFSDYLMVGNDLDCWEEDDGKHPHSLAPSSVHLQTTAASPPDFRVTPSLKIPEILIYGRNIAY